MYVTQVAIGTWESCSSRFGNFEDSAGKHPQRLLNKEGNRQNLYKNNNSTVQHCSTNVTTRTNFITPALHNYRYQFLPFLLFKLGSTARFLLTAAYPATNFARCFYTQPCPHPLIFTLYKLLNSNKYYKPLLNTMLH